MVVGIWIEIVLLSLVWGSFLNMLAYRMVAGKSLLIARSFCPHCEKPLAWYHLIPVISYIALRGRCGYCQSNISFLYPFIELLTLGIGLLFGQQVLAGIWPIESFAPVILFLSALIISTRTDLEHMVIPQAVTLGLLPAGVAAAYFRFLPVTFVGSMVGSLIGYGLLFITGKVFTLCTKKEGIGVGDMELMGLIGAFTGPIGIWVSLLIGSCSGLLLGGGYLLCARKGLETRIPFGPFLSLGALSFLFFPEYFLRMLLG